MALSQNSPPELKSFGKFFRRLGVASIDFAPQGWSVSHFPPYGFGVGCIIRRFAAPQLALFKVRQTGMSAPLTAYAFDLG